MPTLTTISIFIILVAIISRVLWLKGYKQHSKFIVAHSLIGLLIVIILILLLGIIPMVR